MDKNFQDTVRRVESVRKIYSRIGEPLPVSILVDLYRQLGKVPAQHPKGKAKPAKQA